MSNNTAWQNRIVSSDVVQADQLLANPFNWRVHPKAQQQALESVLDSVGWVQEIVVNQRTGHVVDGHLRVALAISRKETVPVKYVDLSEEEESLILAALDPLSAMAVTDADMLSAILDDLRTSELVQEDEALERLLRSIRATTGVDATPVVPDPSPQVNPELDSDCFVEIYCSFDNLRLFQGTLSEWGDIPGVTVNIS